MQNSSIRTKEFFCKESWSWRRCAANGSARARRRPRGGFCVTHTAQALFLHINTIKYRLQRISDLLGYRIGKMPETIELYRSAAIYRLLHAQHEA